LKLYLDHLDMDLSENLSQAYTTEMDASISKIKDKGKEKVNQDDTKGVKARTSTTDMGNEKVSQDETKGVEARTSTADIDFDSEFDSYDNSEYDSDKSFDYLSPW
nr:hypothetical protein [Tanacetum cinerariifolium]